MRVAVVGATGRIGRLTVAQLRGKGHDVVEISRTGGVDVIAGGPALAEAMSAVEGVVDVTSTDEFDADRAVDFFATASRHLLEAEERAGVRHHVTLSIVNVDRVPDNGHYAGKVAQERAVVDSPVPWSILRATQFHDFAETVTGWAENDGTATIAPLLVQPVAPADVAVALAELVVGEPLRRRVDFAGPHTEDLVDMARRSYAARGRAIRLVPTWRGMFGTSMGGEALLPGEDVTIAATSFDDWLAQQTS